MSEKIELKEKLAAVDLNSKNLWDLMDEEQRKSLKQEFFILNRYVSNAASQPREIQEHFVLAVNEYFNKHWFTLQSHPKLLWQLLCMCSHESRKIFFHQWIGFKNKGPKKSSKKTKFLEKIYPNAKYDEIELMAAITPQKQLEEHAAALGYDDAQIKKLFD